MNAVDGGSAFGQCNVQTCPDDGACDPKTDPECCATRVGQPVEVTTGEVFYDAPADINVKLPLGDFVFQRRYSSSLATSQAIDENAGQGKHAFGGGWFHSFEDRIENGTTLISASGEITNYATGRAGGAHGSSVFTADSTGWTVVLLDGSKSRFELVPGSTDQGRLQWHKDTNGRVINLAYFGVASSAPCAVLAGDARDGRLCLISLPAEDFSVFFAEYQGLSCDAPGCVGCVDSCGAGPARLTQILYGNGSTVAAFDKRVRYTYAGRLRKLTDGTTCSENGGTAATCSVDVELDLVQASLEQLSGTTWSGEGTEQYSYVDTSYLRTGLGYTPYETSAPLTVGIDGKLRTVGLLSRITEGGRFKEGHQYDAFGRAATSVAPHEFLRFQYYELGYEFRTVVINESTGTQAEYVMVDGQITDTTAPGRCGSADAVTFKRDLSSGVVTRVTTNNQMAVSYFRDDYGRPILIRQNDNFSTDFSAAAAQDIVDNVLYYGTNGTRFTSIAYASAESTLPSEISPVVSALCSNHNAYWGDFDCDFSGTTSPVTSFTYDPVTSQPLTTTVSAMSLALDANGALIAERHAFTTTSTYDSVTRKLTASGSSDGKNIAYSYYPASAASSLAGRLYQVTLTTDDDSVVLKTVESYDADGRETRVVDEYGVATDSAYDLRGNVVSQTVSFASESRTTTYSYLPGGLLCEQRQQLVGDVVLRGYVYDAPVATMPSAFCATSSVAIECDASGSFSPSSRQACLTALGNLGLAASEFDGVLTAGDYDGVLRNRVRNAAGFKTDENSFIVHDSDLSTSVEQMHRLLDYSNGSLSAFDPTGATALPSTVSYPTGSQWKPSQWTLFPTNGATGTWNYGYDVFGNLQSATLSDGARTVADYYVSYDQRGNISGIGAAGLSLVYLHDDFGRLAGFTDGNNELLLFTYNAKGQQTAVLADDRSRYYSYDGRSRVLTDCGDIGCTASSDVVSYVYDALPSSYVPWVNTSCPGIVPPVHQAGRLAVASYPGGQTVYSYDAFGNVKAVYMQDGGGADICALRVTAYEYDAANRLTAIAYPSGLRVDYDYSGSLRPSSVYITPLGGVTRSLLTNAKYDAKGRLESYASAAVQFEKSIDAAGHDLTRTYLVGGSGHTFAMTRDAQGNVEQFSDGQPDKSQYFMHDADGSVVSSDGVQMRGYQSCQYVKDDLGNTTHDCYGFPLLEVASYGVPTQAVWSTASDTSCGGTPRIATRQFAPSAHGEMQRGYARRFAASADGYDLFYSARGLLESAVTAAGTYTYEYDHKRIRTKKISPDLTETAFVYSADGRLLEEYENGSSVGAYVYVGNEPIAYVIPDVGAVHANLLATSDLGVPYRVYEEETGAVIWAADYEAFGAASTYLPGSSAAPTIDVKLRAPGQYSDTETGLFYNWNRYYDPNFGRYITREPLATDPRYVASVIRQGRAFTTYGYALRNPQSVSDPTGENFIAAEAAILGTAGYCVVRPDMCALAADIAVAAVMSAVVIVTAEMCMEDNVDQICTLTGASRVGPVLQCRYDCPDGTRRTQTYGPVRITTWGIEIGGPSNDDCVPSIKG